MGKTIWPRRIVVVGLASAHFAAATADDNSLRLVQDGATHVGTVAQTGLGNTAGNDVSDIEQLGVGNFLELIQSGDDNEVGLSGLGLRQTGTTSSDSSASNVATIAQSSDGNRIGELVQATLGAHATTGNILTVVQEPGVEATGNNTIYVVNQTVESFASPNIASLVQTGAWNWLERLDQHATSADGDNNIKVTFSGSSNGINGTLSGPGGLGVLALSAGAGPSQIVQGSDASGGAGNAVHLLITGNWNQFGVSQFGAGNTIGTRAITGLSNSFGAYQMGTANQINGGAVVGDSNDLGIRQIGDENTADLNLLADSSDNRVGIGQSGQGSETVLEVTGDANIIGSSQLGRKHSAAINLAGDGNVLLNVQVNGQSTVSLGNKLTVTISGSRNNALVSTMAPSFSGAAFDMLNGRSFGLNAALVVAPDVGAMLGYQPGTLQPGEVVQWGEANTAHISVGDLVASDDNLFAVLQKGSNNSAVAKINGASNQAVMVQIGDENVALVEQSGNRNIAAISQ